MQQMQWREELDEAASEQDLQALRSEMDAAQQALLAECARQLDVLHDYPAAVESVRSLMFIEKFGHELDLAFDKLET